MAPKKSAPKRITLKSLSEEIQKLRESALTRAQVLEAIQESKKPYVDPDAVENEKFLEADV